MQRSVCQLIVILHFKGQGRETSVCPDMAEVLVFLPGTATSKGNECPDSVSVSPGHPLQSPQKLEASVSCQVLPQPMKSGVAWTSRPVQSPQEVGTYCGVNKCTDLVVIELENSASPQCSSEESL